MDATIGPRQAIAVHTGLTGNSTTVPMKVDLVPVLFNVNATTAYGDVRLPSSGVSSLITGWLLMR